MVSSAFETGVYRQCQVLAVSIVVGLGACSAAAQDSAHALLDRMLDAHGGLERFRSLSQWRIVAERNLFGTAGTEHELYEEYLLHDDTRLKTLLIKRRANEVLVYGHDGSTGFALVDGRLRDDPEAGPEGYYRAHGEYYLRSIPFKWADPGVTVSHLGTEASGLELLEIRAEEGVGPDFADVWVAAIDPETHRLQEARLTHRGTREITYRYSDYRAVDGVAFPFRLEYIVGGVRTGENVIQSFDVDAALTGELFTPGHWRSK